MAAAISNGPSGGVEIDDPITTGTGFNRKRLATNKLSNVCTPYKGRFAMKTPAAKAVAKRGCSFGSHLKLRHARLGLIQRASRSHIFPVSAPSARRGSGHGNNEIPKSRKCIFATLSESRQIRKWLTRPSGTSYMQFTFNCSMATPAHAARVRISDSNP
jgi:hypothetical protein